MVNLVVIEGRLTADPILEQSEKGNQLRYCRFSIANDRPKRKDEDTNTDFFNCVAFEATAEVISKWLHKGDSVTVVGRLINDTYEKNGVKRTATKIFVKEVSFGSRKRKSDQSESSILEMLDPAEFEEIFNGEDVPF